MYDPLADALFGPAWDEWRLSVSDFVSVGPVLDLGCGTGKLLERLPQRSIQAFGIDRSPSMLGIAARRIGNRRLVRADATHLPFLDGAFATCVATFPAPFILDRLVLDEIARVLRRGGVLVIMFGGASTTASRPWPVRQMLKVFYGEARPLVELPSEDLHHPSLSGEWKLIPGTHGTALLWLAEKQELGGSVAP